jgi:hypothetical protein
LTEGQEAALTPTEGWDDLVIPATAVNPPGGVQAATQNITELTLDFENGKDCRIDLVYQMPHRWKVGGELRFHLHTFRSTNETGKVARWLVKWRYAIEDSASKAAWTDDAAVLIAVPSGTGPKIIPIKAFTMAGCGISSCVQIQLTRTATHSDDTYNGNVEVYNLDGHYQIARAMGSTNEGSL